MQKLKTVLFVIPDFGGGGAQRVLSVLLNNIDRKQFKPKLLLIKKRGDIDYLQDLKGDIEVSNLNIKSSLKFSALSFVFKLGWYLKRNSVDVLFMGAGTQNAFLSPFLFLFPKKINTIARESNLPSVFERYKIIKFFYKKFYNNYTHIVTQSNDMTQDLVINFNINRNKITKINNPVDNKYILKLSNEVDQPFLYPEKTNLLCAGRLNYQKGFDLLLPFLREKLLENDNLHLTILGDGEDKDLLLNQVRDLGLENKITFLGSVRNPYSYMAKADLFILSSRFEGFPNVLLESLVCGCPVFSNLCPGGINEIILEGVNGHTFSYNDGVNSFQSKLDLCLGHIFNRNAIQKDCIERFGVQTIITNYNNLLNK